MMDEALKNRLTNEFRAYLDRCDERPNDEGIADPPDLFSLLCEMASLKTEVKAENRILKGTLDTLRASHEQLLQTQTAWQEEAAGRQRESLKAGLLEWLDIYDRLGAARKILSTYRPQAGWRSSRPEDIRFIAGIREGQAMTLARVEALLARQGVRPLDALGKWVDPRTMIVVEIERRPDLEQGVVTQELRKGFLWGEEVLRFSEVKANKV